ncbi:uncharacterized protein BO97DRAFT_403938 [Aspergillus homomorphus CBS 101889]|uniref:Uncharacterized protein n=1 Tax=Aspergillus homomorphus (strain CBS 101889) TaxID=1450537 RepID=A0A395I726_ASPHC|nr:hypothetical protein BO97DRAFT_403938 [Aspergillus homomorphus CBS 101889]RAL14898.1 hypothetical protein BO97DRAFT_403938 [Aspergillus homomorphus CBS 101889]
MTSKNLNRTNIDIVLAEFKKDRAASVPFPIRYLLFDRKFRQDIFYEIPRDVEPDTLKRALNQYVRERGTTIEYSHDVFQAWPRCSSGEDEAPRSDSGGNDDAPATS